MSTRSRMPKRGCPSCLGCGAVLGLLFLAGLYGVFLLNNRPPRLTIPTPVPPADNAYDDFAAAAALIRAIPHKAPASMVDPPKSREAILAATAACTKDAAPALAMIRAAFGKQCMIPPDRTATGDLHFREMASFRETARTISGVRTYYALTGQPAKAANVSLDGVEMAAMITRGGSIITSLVAIACDAICLSRFEPLLPQLTKPELAQVAARLDRIAAHQTEWPSIVLEDGRASTTLLQFAVGDPANRGLVNSWRMATVLSPEDDRTARTVMNRFRFVLADKEQMLREHLRYYEHLAEEGKGPYTRRSAVRIPRDEMLPIFDGDNLMLARGKWESQKAVLDVIRLEVALLRYNADRGHFPAQLANLAPTYLKVIPSDPFGGSATAQFHYHLSANPPGFLLYSVGPDMTDNGGTAGRYPPDAAGTDIVAGKLWRQKREF